MPWLPKGWSRYAAHVPWLRYVVAGDVGVRQMQPVAHRCVRGASSVFTEALRDEEVDFARRPEPEHARFVAAREALGRLLARPRRARGRVGGDSYPFLHFVARRRAYRDAPTSRVLTAMTRLYLSRAGP